MIVRFRFIIENGGMENIKSITNDGFMFIEEDKVNTSF